eukprot:10291073-Lingulodinium_polyedra.AAC.1
MRGEPQPCQPQALAGLAQGAGEGRVGALEEGLVALRGMPAAEGQDPASNARPIRHHLLLCATL